MVKINNTNKSIESVLVLPDIRSALNVGALFRTADAVGVSKVYLTGYTPRPTDQFGRIQKDIAKSALGAETWVPWEYKKTVSPLLRTLKKNGYTIVAIEQSPRSISYRSIPKKEKIAFVLGPEVSGLSSRILTECDVVAEIPMKGKKESLNVSVAGGIVLFSALS